MWKKNFWLRPLIVQDISSGFHCWLRPTQHQLMQGICSWLTLLFFFQSKQFHSNSINICDSTRACTAQNLPRPPLLRGNFGWQETRSGQGHTAKLRPTWCLANLGTWVVETTCPPVTVTIQSSWEPPLNKSALSPFLMWSLSEAET